MVLQRFRCDWATNTSALFQERGLHITEALAKAMIFPTAHNWTNESLLPLKWDKSTTKWIQFSSVQFSHSVTSNSLWPHEPQHARLPCPSPTPGVYPNPCPLSRSCHPPISFSFVPFSSCPQSFPASGSFPMSQLFTSGGQSTGVLASTSVLPMNTQDWSPLVWIGWIPCSPRDSPESSPIP